MTKLAGSLFFVAVTLLASATPCAPQVSKPIPEGYKSIRHEHLLSGIDSAPDFRILQVPAPQGRWKFITADGLIDIHQTQSTRFYAVKKDSRVPEDNHEAWLDTLPRAEIELRKQPTVKAGSSIDSRVTKCTLIEVHAGRLEIRIERDAYFNEQGEQIGIAGGKSPAIISNPGNPWMLIGISGASLIGLVIIVLFVRRTPQS